MNRDEQEMALWRDLFMHAWEEGWSPADKAADSGDHAVAEFRKRYPPPPTTATLEEARLGRAAIRAMDTIISIMGQETDHEDKLDDIDRSIQAYIVQRWHIEKKDAP